MNVIGTLSRIKQEWKKINKLGLSMHLRLLLFLIGLVGTIVVGVIIILLSTGIFSVKLNENERLLKKELIHASQGISQQYGQLSMQAVELARKLSSDIEERLSEKGLKVTDLPNHPEVLEDLLTAEYEHALFSLELSKSSGVFLILNATINKKLENAKNSRAGLFIKNMEPNILSSSSPTILLLRGFPSIARKNSISLHVQWDMEFDISDAPYYKLPIEQSTNHKLPLSRLYYWSPAVILPGTSEGAMLCSVPLIDSDGNVFGVSGFEVSSMLFKLAHMPDNSTYTRIFSMLAPINENAFNTTGAMFAGGISAQSSLINNQQLHIKGNRKSFFLYTQEDGESFIGFHVPAKLYPKGSTFFSQKWAIGLMLPEEDIKNSIKNFNVRLSFMFTLLMILGVIISYFISRRYVQPIAEGIDLIKLNKLSEAAKTKVPEIDGLIEHLSTQNKELYQKNGDEQPSVILNEFIENINTLSPAERSVFNLYAQRYTAKEIAGILCLSINTIKTHTKRIYSKLNINSRQELLLRINMLKEAGKELK